MAESLWEVLRQTGLTSLAPVLVKHGALTIPQIKTEASNLLAHGLQQWQLESIITFRTEETQVTQDIPGRPDFPVRYSGKRANIAQAMEAGHPNNRKRSLAQLDADVLARSSNPSQDARLRTYMCLCNIWEVRAFPLDFDNVRAFAASLKAGGYRSASVYFQTICSHQQRHTYGLRCHQQCGTVSEIAYVPSNVAWGCHNLRMDSTPFCWPMKPLP